MKKLLIWMVGVSLVAGAQTAWAELNANEQKRIERRQARIARFEERAKADGVVTPREARRLERMQNRERRQVRRLKHNGRR